MAPCSLVGKDPERFERSSGLSEAGLDVLPEKGRHTAKPGVFESARNESARMMENGEKALMVKGSRKGAGRIPP